MYLYEDIANIIMVDLPLTRQQKAKMSIIKMNSVIYQIKWNDISLWGSFVGDYEFVRYTKLQIDSRIPDEIINFMQDKSFINETFHAKYIGRFIGIKNGKTWVLDIVFPDFIKTRNREYFEYLFGRDAIYHSWKYMYDDSNMIDFVMEKIENINPTERTTVNVLRYLMTEMSSKNSTTGLLEGKWGGTFIDGCHPADWKSPWEVFLKWSLNKRPAKYGQCWVFAECFTTCMRFLGIPARTVFAKNSHINPDLDGSVDFFEDESFMKSEGEETDMYRRISNVNKFITNSFAEEDSYVDTRYKDDIYDNTEIYSTSDSMWNIHYWCECIISRDNITFNWEAIDSCPYVTSIYDPYRSKYILGPCKISSIRSNLNERTYDFEYLHASVNSPFRIWIKETTILNGEIITVPYVHSIVFPFYPKKSIMCTNKKLLKLLDKTVELSIKNHETTVNVTDNYKMSYDLLLRYILQNNPIIFYLDDSQIKITPVTDDEEYYVQQVLIDRSNTMSKIRRQKCKLDEIQCLEYDEHDSIFSILIIKGTKHWVQLLQLN